MLELPGLEMFFQCSLHLPLVLFCTSWGSLKNDVGWILGNIIPVFCGGLQVKRIPGFRV
jgi:hypothetical protein